MKERTHEERVAHLRKTVEGLEEGHCIFLDRRPQVGYWQSAIEELKKIGLIETRFVDMPEEQYARLEIHRKSHKGRCRL